MAKSDTSDTTRQFISEPPPLPIRYHAHPPDPAVFQQPDASLASLTTGSASGQTNWYALFLRAQVVAQSDQADVDANLIAPALLCNRVTPHPYQLHVVRQVLGKKRPAAILADEVGLGKTIEAGLILKELLVRGIACTALVLAPKALLPQWQEELRERFNEDFVLADERRFRGYEVEDRIICSFQQFTRAFERIRPRLWDCLIVDEAHLLANPNAKRRQCVGELNARWRLLLTATPLQNKITDLYSLVDLARPGRLGTLRHFVAEYATDPATCRVVAPAKAAELRAVTNEVMCRTRRDDTGIVFAPRIVRTQRVQAGTREDSINREVVAYLRALYRRGLASESKRALEHPDAQKRNARRAGSPSGADVLNRGALIREIIALQQSLSSSPRAIAASLRERAERHPEESAALLELADRCGQTTSAKERLLLDTLAAHAEPVLIFTLRLETARHLRAVLTSTGRRTECYVGGLSGDQRRDLVTRFNYGDLDALIATDAGAEGLNLQARCHAVFNFDLHWNPMKMEQRIGRVHRLGQTHPVSVTNFALTHSIDEYVLELLYTKIDLFTMTIGGLESVLANESEGEFDLEEIILERWLAGDDPQAARVRLDALGNELLESLRRVRSAESLTTEVLG